MSRKAFKLICMDKIDDTRMSRLPRPAVTTYLLRAELQGALETKKLNQKETVTNE